MSREACFKDSFVHENPDFLENADKVKTMIEEKYHEIVVINSLK